MNGKARWRGEGGNILLTYIETNNLPLASSRRWFANHFFSNKITAILLDNHVGMKNDTLFKHKVAMVRSYNDL
jgi:hypothetical protein